MQKYCFGTPVSAPAFLFRSGTIFNGRFDLVGLLGTRDGNHVFAEQQLLNFLIEREAEKDSVFRKNFIQQIAPHPETELRAVVRFVRNRPMIFGIVFLESLSKPPGLDPSQKMKKEDAFNRKEISCPRV